MNGIFKGLLLALLIVYVISPIDLCPGPIDDLITIAMGIGGTFLSAQKTEY